MSKEKIKVAACQILNTEDVEKSTNKVIGRLKECARQGIEIASFPEGTLFGYCCRADYWKSMEPQVFIDAEARISDVCHENNIAAVVGSAHQTNGVWNNSLAIFERDGTIKARYGKTFLAGEKWCVNNRGPLPIVNLAGVDCCFIICHDIRYPELVKLPAAMGAKSASSAHANLGLHQNISCRLTGRCPSRGRRKMVSIWSWQTPRQTEMTSHRAALPTATRKSSIPMAMCSEKRDFSPRRLSPRNLTSQKPPAAQLKERLMKKLFSATGSGKD